MFKSIMNIFDTHSESDFPAWAWIDKEKTMKRFVISYDSEHASPFMYACADGGRMRAKVCIICEYDEVPQWFMTAVERINGGY